PSAGPRGFLRGAQAGALEKGGGGTEWPLGSVPARISLAALPGGDRALTCSAIWPRWSIASMPRQPDPIRPSGNQECFQQGAVGSELGRMPVGLFAGIVETTQCYGSGVEGLRFECGDFLGGHRPALVCQAQAGCGAQLSQIGAVHSAQIAF